NTDHILDHFLCAVIKDLKYADTHEWVKVDSSSAMIGMTGITRVMYMLNCQFLELWLREKILVQLKMSR
ncbi:hypothetical protein MUK42_31669, partial [Musa troglodytarum]